MPKNYLIDDDDAIPDDIETVEYGDEIEGVVDESEDDDE